MLIITFEELMQCFWVPIIPLVLLSFSSIRTSPAIITVLTFEELIVPWQLMVKETIKIEKEEIVQVMLEISWVHIPD